jgi:uncharacterized membrane protein YbhN (UPF0104 family)
LPATQDTLLMIVYLVVIASAVTMDRAWLAAGIVLTYVSLPSGLILIGFWIVARLLTERPRRWREAGIAAGFLAGTVLIAGLMPRILAALGAPQPGNEYGIIGTLRYFAFLQFTDLQRLVYVALPAGLFPFLMVFAWRRQDWVARAVSLVTCAYFLFFFVQAHISLHHFVPAMVLPIVVAARMTGSMPRVHRAGTAWAAAAALSLVLVFPPQLARHDAGRRIGATISERLGDYASSDSVVLRGSTLLEHVFPYDWDAKVPASSYGGSPLVWNRYATHGTGPTAETNYLLIPSGEPPPQGWRLVTDSAGAALYLLSDATGGASRHAAATPREPMAGRAPEHPVPDHPARGITEDSRRGGDAQVQGVDVDPILARLGVGGSMTRLRRSLLFVIPLLVGGALAIWWARSAGGESLLRDLLSARPAGVLVALAATAGWLFLRFIRWQFLLRRVGVRLPIRSTLGTYIAGLPGTATPAYVGEVIRGLFIKRRFGVPLRLSVAILVLERLYDLAAIATIVLASSAVRRSVTGLQIGAAFLALSFLVAVALWPLSRRAGIQADATRQARLVATVAPAFALSLMAWGLASLLLPIAASALGVSLGVVEGVQIFGSSTLLGALTLLPAGVGATGSFAIIELTGGGLAVDEAVLVVSLMRLLGTGAALTVGAVFCGASCARSRAPPQREPPTSTRSPQYRAAVVAACLGPAFGPQAGVHPRHCHSPGSGRYWPGSRLRPRPADKFPAKARL